MSARKWRNGLMALVTIVAAFAPAASRAAACAKCATINSFRTLGDYRTDRSETAWNDTQVLFPNSLPLGGGYGAMGVLNFSGNATAVDGTLDQSITPFNILVKVTDEFGNSATTIVAPAAKDDPQGGITKGDFAGQITVSNLGTHHVDFQPNTTTPVVPMGGLKLSDPAATQLSFLSHMGGAVLTIHVSASDPAGSTGDYIDGSLSLPTVTKYAADPFDKYPVANISGTTFPPATWCHNPQIDNGKIFLFGRSSPGSQLPYPACSDAGSRQASVQSPPFSSFPDPFNFGYRSQACGNKFGLQLSIAQFDWCDGISAWGSTGESLLSGRVDDNAGQTFGHASEIWDIHLRILQGADVGHAKVIAGPEGDQSNIFRDGPRAFWGKNQKIDNLVPNWPIIGTTDRVCNGNCYFFQTVITDAWGNTASTASGAITIYPF